MGGSSFIEDLYQQLLGVVPGPNDRQSPSKWIVNLTWFRYIICGQLEAQLTEKRLL